MPYAKDVIRLREEIIVAKNPDFFSGCSYPENCRSLDLEKEVLVEDETIRRYWGTL